MQEKIIYTIQAFTLGFAAIVQSEKGVCGLFIGDNSFDLDRSVKISFLNAHYTIHKRSIESLDVILNFLESPQSFPKVCLDMRGTPFQIKVWNAIGCIPYGKTISYHQLAATIEMPRAIRAVSNACAANKIAIIIPCHRVVRCDGSISGYRWGSSLKKELLRRESL